MKKLFVGIVGILLLSVSALAEQITEVGPWDGFWDEVHDFVKKCAVQPYVEQGEGQKSFLPLKSICKELTVNGSRAKFTLKGHQFRATLFDSEFSDGGDINDVVVKDAAGGIVAERNSVLAFGDVLLGLAGGDNNFPQVPANK